MIKQPRAVLFQRKLNQTHVYKVLKIKDEEMLKATVIKRKAQP